MVLRYFWVLWGTSGYFEVLLGTLRYFWVLSGSSRGVIGDIIHYFTFMSSKLTLFALFSIFRHYSLFFQKYENNVITLYTFQNFRLFSTISAGEIGSQGSWPLASCSQLRASSRERWAVCPSRPYLYGRARICVVQAQRVIELFGKKVNNALNVH